MHESTHDPIKDGGTSYLEQNFSFVMKLMGVLILLTLAGVALVIGWLQFTTTF
jgi:hypothetical protein